MIVIDSLLLALLSLIFSLSLSLLSLLLLLLQYVFSYESDVNVMERITNRDGELIIVILRINNKNTLYMIYIENTNIEKYKSFFVSCYCFCILTLRLLL